MSTEANKQIVRRYFEEAVDKKNADILDELFATDCVIHRPEVAKPVVGLDNFRRVFESVVGTYSHLATTIHDMVAEEDRVAVRLHHKMVNRAEWTSRIGRHDVAGKPVGWAAIAIFRIHEGKIAEEWVCRDELGMLIELGVLLSQRHRKSKERSDQYSGPPEVSYKSKDNIDFRREVSSCRNRSWSFFRRTIWSGFQSKALPRAIFKRF